MPEPLSKIGHKFIGWNTLISGAGTHYDEGQSITIGYDNLNLYAEWERIRYYAIYKGSDNTGGTLPSTDFCDPNIGYILKTIESSGDPITKTGYSFWGWYTDNSGILFPGDEYIDWTGDTNFYAVWVGISPLYDDTITPNYSSNIQTITTKSNSKHHCIVYTSGESENAGIARYIDASSFPAIVYEPFIISNNNISKIQISTSNIFYDCYIVAYADTTDDKGKILCLKRDSGSPSNFTSGATYIFNNTCPSNFELTYRGILYTSGETIYLLKYNVGQVYNIEENVDNYAIILDTPELYYLYSGTIYDEESLEKLIEYATLHPSGVASGCTILKTYLNYPLNTEYGAILFTSIDKETKSLYLYGYYGQKVFTPIVLNSGRAVNTVNPCITQVSDNRVIITYNDYEDENLGIIKFAQIYINYNTYEFEKKYEKFYNNIDINKNCSVSTYDENDIFIAYSMSDDNERLKFEIMQTIYYNPNE